MDKYLDKNKQIKKNIIIVLKKFIKILKYLIKVSKLDLFLLEIISQYLILH